MSYYENPTHSHFYQRQARLIRGAPPPLLAVGVSAVLGAEMKPKLNQSGDIYTPKGYDACQTPDYAIDPLLPFLPQWTYWECAAGERNIENGLRCRGYKNVIGTDIITGQNLFEFEPDNWDCIITNPPYSVKYKWLARCYELDKPFALLMPVEVLGTESAGALFDKYGIEVVFIRPRVNFKMSNKLYSGSGAQFPVAWFTWGLNIGKQITFVKVNRR